MLATIHGVLFLLFRSSSVFSVYFLITLYGVFVYFRILSLFFYYSFDAGVKCLTEKTIFGLSLPGVCCLVR